MKHTPTPLMTEDPKNGLRAITAFFKANHVSRLKRKEYDYVFEHGQLWIKHFCSDNNIWSVVDAEGSGTFDGFDFEPLF